MREPSFWWGEASLASALLAPLAAIYGAVAQARLGGRGRRAGAPVVCIGNLTVGGAGKTPTALAVARMLAAAGERPVFLSRGYGGTLAGPVRVDPARHGAYDVGDEPLLLARMAPTIVARDRVKGAAIAAGASVIVMDDGFHNPSLTKDFSVLVVDARRGIGNGRVIPAGPLRAPLDAQLSRAHALVVVGASSRAVAVAATARDIPVLQARLRPDAAFIAGLGGARVLAFAGIGDPEKFFLTLADAGVALAARRSFPDHHRYTRAQAKALCEEAARAGLVLVTTEKDLARLGGADEAAELAAQARALPVTLAFEDEERFKSLLLERLAAARKTNDGRGRWTGE
ncbi:MAG: tetraacyldisaccharide 4'-kinase [Alphaproteobacteria bacterium]|nr:MAG: tetraacyldisaccharide 4'-kinase [Alphaproteobacteria bacterium]